MLTGIAAFTTRDAPALPVPHNPVLAEVGHGANPAVLDACEPKPEAWPGQTE